VGSLHEVRKREESTTMATDGFPKQSTWPVVKFGRTEHRNFDLYSCGKCGIGFVPSDGTPDVCEECGAKLVGEVSQGEVAKFLEQSPEGHRFRDLVDSRTAEAQIAYAKGERQKVRAGRVRYASEVYGKHVWEDVAAKAYFDAFPSARVCYVQEHAGWYLIYLAHWEPGGVQGTPDIIGSANDCAKFAEWVLDWWTQFEPEYVEPERFVQVDGHLTVLEYPVATEGKCQCEQCKMERGEAVEPVHPAEA
jgi:hypothetical protein